MAVYSQIYDVIHSSGVRTILIPGNHDILNKKRFNECILRPFGNRFEHTQQLDTSGPNLVAWEPSIVVIGKCKIALIPYSDKPEQTEKWIVQCGKVDYIIGHFSVKGMSEHIDNSIDSGKVNDRKFIKAFLGHYHKEIEIGSYYHIGAFTQRNFGEEGNSTGFIVLDVDGNSTPTTIRVEVPGLKIFKTIKISNDEDYKLFKEKYNEGKFDKYFVRVDYGKDLKRFTRNFDKEIDFNQLEKTRDKVIYDVDSNIKDMLVDYTNRTCILNNIEKVIERGLDVVSTIGGNK